MLNTNYTNERIQIISDAKIQEFLKLFIICEYLFKTLVRISDSKIKEVKFWGNNWSGWNIFLTVLHEPFS